jgi:hypothetical protein
MAKEPGKAKSSKPTRNGQKADEFERFEDMTKRLLGVPKKELDEARAKHRTRDT